MRSYVTPVFILYYMRHCFHFSSSSRATFTHRVASEAFQHLSTTNNSRLHRLAFKHRKLIPTEVLIETKPQQISKSATWLQAKYAAVENQQRFFYEIAVQMIDVELDAAPDFKWISYT
jgi:hypothetical protein